MDECSGAINFGGTASSRADRDAILFQTRRQANGLMPAVIAEKPTPAPAAVDVRNASKRSSVSIRRQGTKASIKPEAPATARQAKASVRNDRSRTSMSAREHFAHVGKESGKLDQTQQIAEGKDHDEKLTSEISKNFQGVAHLTEELDGLFAEMGRQTAVVRARQCHQLRLIPNVARTVEVKLPRRTKDNDGELTIQLECHCDSKFHITDQTDISLRKGLLEEVDFDILVAESQRCVPDGPFKAQSLKQSEHRVRFSTDVQCLFVCLSSKSECHIDFFCRVWQGELSEKEKTQQAEYYEDDDQHYRLAASVGMKLKTKLKACRQDLKDQQKELIYKETEDTAVSAVPASPTACASSSSRPHKFGGRSFGDYVWDGGKPPRDEVQVLEAQRRIVNLWLGPCNKYVTKARRAKGQWVRSLSRDCPRKIIKFLQKAVEDRAALTFIASAGVFQFFFKRQRELHLMRAHMAMRQLVWYKAMFAASRIRYLAFIVSKGRSNTQQENQTRKDRASLSARRKSDQLPWREMVQTHCTVLQKAKSRRSPRQAAKPSGQTEEICPASPSNAKVLSSEDSPLMSRRGLQGSIGALKDLSTCSLSSNGCPLSPSGANDERKLLERRLASQGFILNPNASERAANGTRARQANLAPGVRQKNCITDISQSIGRQLKLDTPPDTPTERQISGDEELDRIQAKAFSDVDDQVYIVTVSPGDLAKFKHKGFTQEIGSPRFEPFFQSARKRAAGTLIRREVRQENIVTGIGQMRVKIAKRYLLQFFEAEHSDLPWLSITNNLMLVIHGKTQFQSAQEQASFNMKLRSFNQIRKAALKRPGLFAPLEAALWSHPVIVQLAAKLQKAMCSGDGALAWKSGVFENCQELSSDRDIGGASLYSGLRSGGENSYLRKLADVGGQFGVDARGGECLPLAAELTPFDVTTAATTTEGKVRVHAFGESEQSYTNQMTVSRYENKVLELPHETVPRDLRIEMLREKRRARDRLECPRGGYPLEAHSDLKAQERYGEWMMRTDVPEAARSNKAEMLSFFESLVLPDALTFSPPLATCKRKECTRAIVQANAHLEGLDTSLHHEASSMFEDSPEPQHGSLLGPGTPAGRKGVSANADHVGVLQQDDAVHSVGDAGKNSRRPREGVGRPSRLEGGGSTGTAQAVLISNPQTAEDVGQLFLQMDALQTILTVDASEIGGFANRCPAGWRSGYREEPMSKKEIRTAHIVQKFCAGKPATTFLRKRA